MRKVVIGLGNPFRRDDAAGLEVACRVRRVEAHLREGASYDLIHLWEGADEAIIVDAMRSGEEPGTVFQLDPMSFSLPAGAISSSHEAGLVEALEMARALGHLPPKMTVYGIEVGDVSPGSGLTPAVEDAVRRVVAEIEHA